MERPKHLVFIDKAGKQVSNGDVINIHQTVNGENLFVMLDLDELDLRYAFDMSYKYQYSVIDLLKSDRLNGGVEWGIVGSLHSFLQDFR